MKAKELSTKFGIAISNIHYCLQKYGEKNIHYEQRKISEPKHITEKGVKLVRVYVKNSNTIKRNIQKAKLNKLNAKIDKQLIASEAIKDQLKEIDYMDKLEQTDNLAVNSQTREKFNESMRLTPGFTNLLWN